MLKRFAMIVAMLLGLLGGIGLVGVASGGEKSPPTPPPSSGSADPNVAGGINAPMLQYIAPGIFEIGKCKITKEEGKVEFPATVNMREGLLEYLLVGNSGKLHESLLRTEVEPYALQIALLLSGLEGSLNHLTTQGENRLPEGDPVDITVSWNENGKEKRVRIEEMVLQQKESVSQIPWVFTGSIVYEGAFAAQTGKSIIAIYHDPTAMIDNRLESGSNDELWFVNGKTTPPVGTPMTVTIVKKTKLSNK